MKYYRYHETFESVISEEELKQLLKEHYENIPLDKEHELDIQDFLMNLNTEEFPNRYLNVEGHWERESE
jgi:hypothetical protein